MNPIENWENVKPVGGESVQLPAGGYICKIVGAKTVVNKKNREMLEIGVDICTGDYESFFRQKFNAGTDKSKWPNAATIRFTTPDKSIDTQEEYDKKAGRIKKFIQDVENSNSPYVFKWDETTLRGKYVGCLFGREEFETQDGKRAWSTKVFYTTPMGAIRDGKFKVPEDRPIKESSYGPMPDYGTMPPEDPNAFQQIEQEEDLPF